MSATIKLLGSLKQYVGGRSEVSVSAGRSVRQAIQELGLKPEIVAMVVVNDAPADKEYVLQEGDVVKLLAVIGGG